MNDDLGVFQRFERQLLTPEEWTHEMHIRVGWLHTTMFAFDDALAHVRDGIRRLNEALGGKNTANAGYHETMTRCWLTMILHTHQSDDTPASVSIAFVRRHPELLIRTLLLEHYSKELLMSQRARREWVPPDLRALPLTR